MTTIARIQALPTSPYENSGFVGIVITSGIPSYFRITGSGLDQIVDINWFPENPSSVIFETRQLILVDNTVGTFMVRVIDNLLDNANRGGKLSFRLSNGSTLSALVKTYGPVSAGPLWVPPSEGLITG